MQTTFMEAVSITLSSMAIVLATLALIAFILGSFKHLFKEEKPKAKAKPAVNKVVEENDEEKGRFVRKERYSGACSRSFYVGENITEDEIKAKFKNGTLTIIVPKKEDKKELPSKKYIEIE